MTIKSRMVRLFEDPVLWSAGALLGSAASYIDLHSRSRLPHALLLFSSCALLAAIQPRWPWRWALLLGLNLPAAVLITGHWGPYEHDQFDVFYGLVTCLAGVAVGAGLRIVFATNNTPPLNG